MRRLEPKSLKEKKTSTLDLASDSSEEATKSSGGVGVPPDGSVTPLRLGFQLGVRGKLAYHVFRHLALWQEHDVVVL